MKQNVKIKDKYYSYYEFLITLIPFDLSYACFSIFVNISVGHFVALFRLRKELVYYKKLRD